MRVLCQNQVQNEEMKKLVEFLTEYLEDELKRKRNVLHKKISEEMNKKNPRWYEAMVLVYYMDMPQVKAAELMGINLRTLHSLLHRAKNWIKKNYKAEYEEMNRED